MFTLRCTKKLLTRLRLKPAPRAPPSTTKLGDWYADTLNLGRERLVLCVSELTLLPVVVPAIGAATDLDAKLARGLRQTLEALGAPAAAIDAEMNQLLEVTIAKTASRVVLGSMNDFQFMVRHIRNQLPHASLLELGLKLADTPCSPIKYSAPNDAALVALGGKPVRPKTALRVAPPPPATAPTPRTITNAEYAEMIEAATVDAPSRLEACPHLLRPAHLRDALAPCMKRVCSSSAPRRRQGAVIEPPLQKRREGPVSRPLPVPPRCRSSCAASARRRPWRRPRAR